jgi:glycosyltransferase involved in cell wall biosynthesis
LKLHIVVPCYNEEAVISETAAQLDQLLDRLVSSGRISTASRVTFVDDGSRDATWPLIESQSLLRSRVYGIKLSRNCGHQTAVLAGMLAAEGDAIVSIDADLQDDIEAITLMIDEYNQGSDIVYGIRSNRSSDSMLKRSSARSFYRILAWFGVEVIQDHADFRLMSRRAVDSLRDFSEVNLYLRGIVPLIGFKTSSVHYARKERFAGTSKYPLRKMLGLAVEAITSFSTVPLQMIMVLGCLIFLGSLAISAWVLWVSLFTSRAVPGWASTVLPMYFLGGIQTLCIGIVGAYLGKVYRETKRRPRFFIERTSEARGRPLQLDTAEEVKAEVSRAI